MLSDIYRKCLSAVLKLQTRPFQYAVRTIKSIYFVWNMKENKALEIKQLKICK